MENVVDNSLDKQRSRGADNNSGDNGGGNEIEGEEDVAIDNGGGGGGGGGGEIEEKEETERSLCVKKKKRACSTTSGDDDDSTDTDIGDGGNAGNDNSQRKRRRRNRRHAFLANVLRQCQSAEERKNLLDIYNMDPREFFGDEENDQQAVALYNRDQDRAAATTAATRFPVRELHECPGVENISNYNQLESDVSWMGQFDASTRTFRLINDLSHVFHVSELSFDAPEDITVTEVFKHLLGKKDRSKSIMTELNHLRIPGKPVSQYNVNVLHRKDGQQFFVRMPANKVFFILKHVSIFNKEVTSEKDGASFLSTGLRINQAIEIVDPMDENKVIATTNTLMLHLPKVPYQHCYYIFNSKDGKYSSYSTECLLTKNNYTFHLLIVELVNVAYKSVTNSSEPDETSVWFPKVRVHAGIAQRLE